MARHLKPSPLSARIEPAPPPRLHRGTVLAAGLFLPRVVHSVLTAHLGQTREIREIAGGLCLIFARPTIVDSEALGPSLALTEVGGGLSAVEAPPEARPGRWLWLLIRGEVQCRDLDKARRVRPIELWDLSGLRAETAHKVPALPRPPKPKPASVRPASPELATVARSGYGFETMRRELGKPEPVDTPLRRIGRQVGDNASLMGRVLFWLVIAALMVSFLYQGSQAGKLSPVRQGS